MSYVTPVAGEQLLIKIGDGGGPEVFTAWATVNASRDMQMTTSEKTTEIPRTDTPGAPAYVDREITAVDWVLTGAGVLNNGDDVTAGTWLLAGTTKNVKVIGITSGLTLTGPAKLTDFKITGDRGGKVMFTATFKGTGIPVLSTT